MTDIERQIVHDAADRIYRIQSALETLGLTAAARILLEGCQGLWSMKTTENEKTKKIL